MAKDRTSTSRFPSKKGGGWVSGAQYITECLCLLIAWQEKKELADRFWQRPPWDKLFRSQIPAANELLQKYNVNVIIATLRDRRCWKVKSLRALWLLEPILKEKQAVYDLEQQQAANAPILQKTSTVQPQRKVTGKKSLLALLREAEKNERPD